MCVVYAYFIETYIYILYAYAICIYIYIHICNMCICMFTEKRLRRGKSQLRNQKKMHSLKVDYRSYKMNSHLIIRICIGLFLHVLFNRLETFLDRSLEENLVLTEVRFLFGNIYIYIYMYIYIYICIYRFCLNQHRAQFPACIISSLKLIRYIC